MIESLSPVNPATKNRDTPNQILESARQFEALLIGQLMRGMRESAGGWLGSGEDQAGASMAEFAEQQMAQLLSANGGFGLASMIQKDLSKAAQPQTLKDAASAKLLTPP